jgi:hypothetical protein
MASEVNRHILMGIVSTLEKTLGSRNDPVPLIGMFAIFRI